MRIDLYGSGEAGGLTEVGVAGGVGAAAGHQGKASAVAVAEDSDRTTVSDRTTLSTSSQSVSSLTSQALALASERSQRVESLRQSVNSGDYKLEPDAIAQAILKDRA